MQPQQMQKVQYRIYQICCIQNFDFRIPSTCSANYRGLFFTTTINIPEFHLTSTTNILHLMMAHIYWYLYTYLIDNSVLRHSNLHSPVHSRTHYNTHLHAKKMTNRIKLLHMKNCLPIFRQPRWKYYTQ